MRKGQGLSMEFIIISAIALVVLIVIILFFTGGLAEMFGIPEESFDVKLSSCHNETDDKIIKGCISGCRISWELLLSYEINNDYLVSKCEKECSQIWTEEVCSSEPVDEIVDREGFCRQMSYDQTIKCRNICFDNITYTVEEFEDCWEVCSGFYDKCIVESPEFIEHPIGYTMKIEDLSREWLDSNPSCERVSPCSYMGNRNWECLPDKDKWYCVFGDNLYTVEVEV